MVLVTRPRKASLAEADRTSRELTSLGIKNQHLVVNGVMPESDSNDPLASALREREKTAMNGMPESLANLPVAQVALQPRNMVGVPALRAVFSGSFEGMPVPQTTTTMAPLNLPSLTELIDEIEADGHGLVMVLGKGGVGKTTVAAAIAAELADRGHPVHLTTTDPAAHVSMMVESDVTNLLVSRIDPQAERDRYRQHVMETKGKNLDEAGRRLLEEDLRSPCTEEIAVFQAFTRIMRESRKKFVIVDTAPTGHTLMLLDATGSYHRDVVRHSQLGTRMVTPMMRLQDPGQTKMLIVTLPETTPVLEAESLQADLRRAEIEPWAWVINSSLVASSPSDPLLVARASEEVQHIERVQQAASRLAILPWLPQEPVGRERLLELARSETVCSASTSGRSRSATTESQS